MKPLSAFTLLLCACAADEGASPVDPGSAASTGPTTTDAGSSSGDALGCDAVCAKAYSSRLHPDGPEQ